MVLVKGAIVSVLTILAACSSHSGSSKEPDNTDDLSGEALYNKTCKMCHGKDGKRGLSGATDLSKSTLSKAEAKVVVENGRNQMAGYKEMYSAEEIDAIVAYIQTLKK